MANYAEEIAVAIVIVTSSRRFTNISRLAPSNRLTRSLSRQFYVFSYISVTFDFTSYSRQVIRIVAYFSNQWTLSMNDCDEFYSE